MVNFIAYANNNELIITTPEKEEDTRKELGTRLFDIDYQRYEITDGQAVAQLTPFKMINGIRINRQQEFVRAHKPKEWKPD